MPKNILNTSEVQKNSLYFLSGVLKLSGRWPENIEFSQKKKFFKKIKNSAVKVIWLFFKSHYLLEKVGPTQFLSDDGKNIDLVSSKKKFWRARSPRAKKLKITEMSKCVEFSRTLTTFHAYVRFTFSVCQFSKPSWWVWNIIIVSTFVETKLWFNQFFPSGDWSKLPPISHNSNTTFPKKSDFLRKSGNY